MSVFEIILIVVLALLPIGLLSAVGWIIFFGKDDDEW